MGRLYGGQGTTWDLEQGPRRRRYDVVKGEGPGRKSQHRAGEQCNEVRHLERRDTGGLGSLRVSEGGQLRLEEPDW